ncbi:mechanosensitive ion channel family protein [Sulfitobacter sp. PS-8MA]|uniref:mechanosensitive ion channel family protein n=1 Tax=Sulfitobacter sp. PS-8MA TaxID=3237707 RepID=UPI0034C63FC9
MAPALNRPKMTPAALTSPNPRYIRQTMMRLPALLRPLALLPRLLGLMLLALSLLLGAAAGQAQEKWFETTELNPGLPPAPDTIDRGTPMAAVESFIYLTSKGHYSDAAHVLDLSDLPQGNQATLGAERAFQLAVLMERKVVVPWGKLADRPDGWLSGSSEDNDTGRVRRSVLIDRLELGGHDVPLRLNRVKPGKDAAPVWVFSRQSVDNIPPLHAKYGPTDLENLLPEWLRGRAFWGMYLWEVLFLPILLTVALMAGWFAFDVMRRLGEAASRRWMRFVLRSFRWPAAIVLCAAIIGIATSRVLVVSGLIDAVLSPILLIAYVTAATLAIVFTFDEIFDRISPNNAYELADPMNAHMRSIATTIAAARKGVIVIAVLVASGVILVSINADNTLGLSILASAGALTIVLGFAAREVLGNILASVQIALNRSARIGDQLIFEGHFCTVERIHFTYVQLMNWEGTRLIVPVAYFVSDAFENWSIEDHAMVRPIVLTLAQTADVQALRHEFFNLLAKEDPNDVTPMSKAKVHVLEQDAFGVKVRFEVPTDNAATFWDIECRVREGLLAAAAKMEADGKRMLPPVPADMGKP